MRHREHWRCPLCGKHTSFWLFRMTRPLCWHRRTRFKHRTTPTVMEREWRS